jgi:hypothetical protein
MPARLVPPGGSPNKLEAQDEAAWNEMVSDQLPDVRRSAENLRNGLAGLLTLIGIFSVIHGPSELNGLAGWAAIAAGVLLLLGFGAAVAGVLSSLDACYGHPVIRSRAAFRSVGGRDGLRFEEARQAAAQMGRARVLTVLALALAVAAIGITWYAPRTTGDIVVLTTRSGIVQCGRLVQSSDGKVQIDAKTTGAVLVNLADVTSIRTVTKCP